MVLWCMMGKLTALAKKRYEPLFLVIISQMSVGSLGMYIMQPWNSQADAQSSFVLLMINMFIIVTANCSTSRAWYYIIHILLSQPASGIVQEISEKQSLEFSLSTLVGGKKIRVFDWSKENCLFYANETLTEPWLLSNGLTCVSCNKGLTCFMPLHVHRLSKSFAPAM